MTTKQVFICAAVVGASLCHGQGNVIYYGANSNALDVVFADTTLSVTNRSLIVADLNLCLLGLGKIVELHFYEQEIDGKIGYLRNPKRRFVYSFFPEDIVATPNGHALQISQILSDAYTNAFAFAAAHSNIVAAAYEFVAFVSSPDFANIPASDLPNYFLPKNLSDAEVIADAQNHIANLQKPTYYPPSILGFGYMEMGPGPATTNLFMAIPCVFSAGNWGSVTAIWHDEKWKFANFATTQQRLHQQIHIRRRAFQHRGGRICVRGVSKFAGPRQSPTQRLARPTITSNRETKSMTTKQNCANGARVFQPVLHASLCHAAME